MNPFNSFVILIGLATARASCDEKPLKCISSNIPCSHDPDACCDSLGCFGYNFFKRCKEPPACLDQWNDCSQGMECCGEMVCALTKAGSYECQDLTLKTIVVDPLGRDNHTPAPVPIEEKNLRTTKIPNQPVNTVVGCSVGDPHLYSFGKSRCHVST